MREHLLVERGTHFLDGKRLKELTVRFAFAPIYNSKVFVGGVLAGCTFSNVVLYLRLLLISQLQMFISSLK